MNKRRIYFDNAASTPVSKKVIKKIKPFLTKYYGNPSSSHLEGRIAHFAIEEARKKIAKCLNCNSDEIFFTSGASESNAWIIKSIGNIFTFGDTHSSIEMGIQKDDYKEINCYALSAINNETGKDGSYEYIDKFELILVDYTQTIGKRRIDLSGFDSFASMASFSAHKFGGIKGTGVLFVRKKYQSLLKPLIYGHQENGFRGGTENVLGIIAMGEAMLETYKNIDKNIENIKKVSNYIYKNIKNNMECISKITCNNGILNITFENINANYMVMMFDKNGIAISAGSACNSGSDEPSQILINEGYTEEEAINTIRISIGHQNTIKEAKKFCRILRKIIDKTKTV